MPRPAVALESTVISHGLPYPHNLQLAQEMEEIVRRVENVPVDKEIIVVDDCSTDRTPDIARDLESAGRVRYFRHQRNLGKGAALRTGFGRATGDIVLIQDADLEYNPADYPALLQPILDKHCVSCHNYDGRREGGVSLVDDRGPVFSHSYITLIHRKQVVDGANGVGNTGRFGTNPSNLTAAKGDTGKQVKGKIQKAVGKAQEKLGKMTRKGR